MPGSPTYVQVANNNTGNSLDFSFKRSNDDGGSGGDTYDIRYSTAAQMTNPTTHLDYITATGANNYSGTTPTSLSSGTTYYFQARFKE